MKLERLAVHRYGPLTGFDEALHDGLQLVHGPNESGKTLLVEALVELLAGDAVGDRVEGAVQGFADVRDGEERFTVDGGDALLGRLDAADERGLTPAGFRNVFVIRDADLAVDGGYYERATERVTGLRSGDIRRLQAAVREEGRLTETRLDLSSAEEHGDPDGQVDAARALRRDVAAYLAEGDERALEAAERELFAARRRAERLEEEVSALLAARERERIDDHRETVAELRSALEAQEDLPSQGALDDLRRRLEGLAERSGEEAALARRLSLYRPVALGGLVLAVVGAAAGLAGDLGPAAAVGPALGVTVAAVGAVRWGRANRALAGLERDRADALERAREAGLDPDGVEDLRASVAGLAERRRDVGRTVDRAVGALGQLSEVDGGDPAAVAEAAAARLDARERELAAVDRPFDEAELAERREALEAAQERAADLAAELETHRDALDGFADRARELDFERFAGEPLDLEVGNLAALERLRDRLDGLVAAVESDAAAARTAHDVLGAMAADEGEKVEALFGPDSRASELFGALTGGRYDAVRYDADRESVVVDLDGEALRPADLSHGTRDQLFFGVRVGLAEQLLGGARGFLVLDDAFLAADPDRLDRGVAALERLAAAGWQVLYLTAQGDAVARLRERCPSPIELAPLGDG